MSFLTATGTDIGTRKKTNQDSALILQADTDRGPVLLASICDGMGGLGREPIHEASWVSYSPGSLLPPGREIQQTRQKLQCPG